MNCFCVEQPNLEIQSNYVVLKYSLGLTYIVRIAHMEGEQIFGSCKWKVNLTLELECDSHRDDHVNFSHPHVNHIIVRLGVEIEQPGANQIQGDVEVLEGPCGDGVWHRERCPLTLHVQCSTLQKSTKHSCVTRIIAKQTFISVPTLIYLRLWS